MIYRLSDTEIKEAQTIEDSYERLIKECEDRIAELRPDGYDERGLPNVEPKDFEKWVDAGSDEWRAERKKRLELVQKSNETIRAYFNRVYDDHFKKIAGDPDAIVADAIDEIDDYIPRMYAYYQTLNVGFQAQEVRATEDGFLLDSDEVIKRLTDLLAQRHIKGLGRSKKRIAQVNEHLVKVVDESALTSSTIGERFGRVMKMPKPVKHETTEESEVYTVVRPTKYMTPVDRVTKLAFDNKLTKPVDADPEALWEVSLEPRKSKNEVIARVAIDYAELLKSGDLSELPELTSDDYNVLDAIISLRNAGNYAFTKTMLYRAMTGKIKGDVKVAEEMSELIDAALNKFKGTVNLEYTKHDRDGNELTLILKEPIVTYIIGDGYINGKYVDELIITPKDERFTPPFEKWARFNGNEIDTRDITLLDVPKLNNGKESRDIKMCLYRRLISMRNTFERVKKSKYELADNQRTIRYDYIYQAIGIEDPDANKRRLLKDKIDRCMKYWTSKGLISGYEHKRDKSSGNNFYAVMVSFMPKE